MWTIVLVVCVLALLTGGLGVLIFIARKSNISNTSATNNNPNQQQNQNPPPPNPTPTPSPKWYEDLENLKWAGVIIGVIMIPLVLLPVEYTKSLLSWSLTFRIVFCFLAYGLIKHFLFPDVEGEKKQFLSITRLLLAIAILSQLYFYREAIVEKLPSEKIEGLGSKIGSFFTPAPPPEKVWKGSTIIEAPVESDWSKVPEVKDLHYGIVEWNMTNLAPHEKGRYEIMADGWPKPFIGGDGSKECQGLPDSLRFKIRSLEAYPIKLRLEWR